MSDPPTERKVKVKSTWPCTKANWRRLKLAFAGCLHAWADRIEIEDHRRAEDQTAQADWPGPPLMLWRLLTRWWKVKV